MVTSFCRSGSLGSFFSPYECDGRSRNKESLLGRTLANF
jgi:hypothetical protein